MVPVIPRRVFVVTLLMAALSLPWLAGAHQHLCFDGLEPAVTLHHLVDGDDHQEHHRPESGHLDADVEFDTRLTRALKDGADGPAVRAAVAHASAGTPAPSSIGSTEIPVRARSAPRFLQPPLRAPPA